MITCKICPGRVFPNDYAYNQHARTSKAHANRFPCTICLQSFPSFFARNGHLTKNHQDLLCRLCNRYYRSRDALEQHYRSDPNHPSCSKCEAAFPDKAALTRHTSIAHPAPLQEFLCHPCQLAFENQTELFDHLKSSGSHPLCLVCDQGLADLPRFDEHIKSIHPELFCNICNVGCQSEDQLLSHYRSVASPLHPTCDLCNEGFRDVSTLDEHIWDSHGISPIESVTSYGSDAYCLKCDATFDDYNELQEHFAGSPFHPTCIPCGQGFLDDVAHKAHLNAIHSTSPASHRSSKRSSPVLSPPRSLRSLTTSPRSGNRSLSTSRAISPLPRNPSPTFYTSHSSRSTRANSLHSSTSESGMDANQAAPLQPTVRSRASSLTLAYSSLNGTGNGWQAQSTTFEAASISPRPSSAPTASSTVRLTVEEPVLAGLEPPPSTPIIITPARDNKRLGLRVPEPLCTVELMTPSVLGDESPTYESSPSTPERLATPSSLLSYAEETGSSQSPALAQGNLASTPSPVSLAQSSPTHSSVSPPAGPSEPAFSEQNTRASSRASFTTMATAKEIADRVGTPSQASSPSTSELALGSPVVTAIPVDPTQEEIAPESYRVTEDPQTAQRRSDAQQALERAMSTSTFRTTSASSEYTSDDKNTRKDPPTYTSCRGSSTQRTHSRESSNDSSTKALSSQANWHCRLCMDEPHEPTVTMCGHLFCHRCIVTELSKNFQCPVCKKMMLVRLHVD